MKLTVPIDEVGRIVLPKSVRESLGISGRSRVSLEVFGGKAEISATDETASKVCLENGRVVSCVPLPEGWDSGDAVLRIRERRIQR